MTRDEVARFGEALSAMTRDEVAQEVCGRFAEALSFLVRGAVDEMSRRGIDRAAASAATQAVLRYVADNGPRPLGGAAVGEDP